MVKQVTTWEDRKEDYKGSDPERFRLMKIIEQYFSKFLYESYLIPRGNVDGGCETCTRDEIGRDLGKMTPDEVHFHSLNSESDTCLYHMFQNIVLTNEEKIHQ